MRAELELDFEANEEAITQIDKELELLGVEEITYPELSEIAEASIEPRITPTAQQYVKHLSERVVAVCNGEQYELQIITSVPTDDDSVLRPSYEFRVQTEAEQLADNVRFCTTLAGGLISLYTMNINGETILNETFTKVKETVETAFSLYDIYSAYSDAVSPITKVEDADNTGLISIGIHERHVFIKSYGAVDQGNQILMCSSNRVHFDAAVIQEEPFFVGDVSQPNIRTISFEGIYYSQFYSGIDSDGDGINNTSGDRDEMIRYVCNLYWNYRKYGNTNFDVNHRITELLFDWAGGEKIEVSIPYNGLSWIE